MSLSVQVNVVPGILTRFSAVPPPARATLVCPSTPVLPALVELYLLLNQWERGPSQVLLDCADGAAAWLGSFGQLGFQHLSWSAIAHALSSDTLIQIPSRTARSDDTLEPLHQWLVQLRQDEPFRVAVDCIVVEAIDNAFEHSESTVPPVLMAVIHRHPFRLEFAIADAGIGILRSLQQNPPYARLSSEVQAVELALQEGVSSKPGKTRGGGLPTICRAIAGRRGSVVLRSGAGEVAIDAGLDETHQISQRHSAPWPGTQLICTIPPKVH